MTQTELAEPSAWQQIVLSTLRMSAVLLRNRRRIIVCAILGGAIGLTVALVKRAEFTASATFMPQSAGDGNAGLRSLAGQFGIALPTANATESADFYRELVTSPAILGPVAADSFATSASARPEPLSVLLETDNHPPAIALERTTDKLKKLVSASVDKPTGVITVAATTPWRAVSIRIVSLLVDAVNEFNLKTRQTQASAERKFIEARLAVVNSQLRADEDQLQSFLEHNRTAGAPRVRFDSDRLQRAVSQQQQIATALQQSLEDARLREVRDTPVITVIQGATARVEPDPRHAGMLALLGGVAGAVLAILVSAVGEVARNTQMQGQADAESFSSALDETAFGRLWRGRRRSA